MMHPSVCQLARNSAFRWVVVLGCLAGCSGPGPARPDPATPSVRRLDGTTISHAEIDATVARLMTAARVPGLALAIINDGQVAFIKAYGWRNVEHREALTIDTSMPGASFTKAAYALMVMQLVAEGRLDLDRPVEQYLPKPLVENENYRDLAGDARHHQLTARMLLSHTSGLPNWRRFNDDKKLDIKFDPGTRYSYSGEESRCSSRSCTRSSRRQPVMRWTRACFALSG
jgi:CubicO group peptidase (beta-lactamase class C family)